MSYGQAALVLAKGNNILQPSAHPHLQKWNPLSLSFDDSGQVFSQDAADNLLKSLGSNDVAAGAGKQVRLDQADAQVKDAATAVQTAQAKLKSLTALIATNRAPDPAAQSQMLAEYNRARARLTAAQAAQNAEVNQPLGVTTAQAAKTKDLQKAKDNAEQAAKAVELIRQLSSNNALVGVPGM
jgi:hypothetical protein